MLVLEFVVHAITLLLMLRCKILRFCPIMHLVMSHMGTFSGKRPHFISRSQRLMHPCSYQQPSFTVLHIFALKQSNIEILLFFPPLVVEVLFWRCGLPNTGEALWNMCSTCKLVGRMMVSYLLVVILAKYQKECVEHLQPLQNHCLQNHQDSP